MTAEKWEELHILVDALVEGQITEAQAEQLRVWLAVDDDAQRAYLRAIDMHANLAWDLCPEVSPPAETGGPCADAAAVDATPQRNNPVAPVHDVAGDTPISVDAFVASAAPRALEPVELPARARRHWIWRRLFGGPSISVATSIAMLLVAFTVVAAGERILRAIFHQHAVEPHQAGGVVRLSTDADLPEILPGGSPVGTRRIGSSLLPDTALVNLLVFRLPRLEEAERIGSARLEWTYKLRAGQPKFSVDLYGLGYVSSTNSLSGCFWEGGDDRALRTAYGMRGPKRRRIAPIARGVMNPQTATGRIALEGPALVSFLQSLYDDGARGGEYVVFRLNADVPTAKIARRTGYEIVHPPEVRGKTLPAEFPALKILAKGTSADPDVAVPGSALTAHCIEPSQWSATLVRSDGIAELGPSKHGTRLVGSSNVGDRALANLLVFRLPRLEDFERVGSARLEWSYREAAGNPPFAVDLYGLGCVPSASSLSNCFWEGERDTSQRSHYGMLGDSQRPVALVARSVIDRQTPRGRIAVEGRELVKFLQSLYDDGAQGGELVVFRLNADAPTSALPIRSGYEIVHPPEVEGKTTPAEFPMLQIVPSFEEPDDRSVARSRF